MTYLILSTQFWSDNWVSKHWIAHWLAEQGHEVFYVEPFRDIPRNLGDFWAGPRIRTQGKVQVVSFASLPYYYHAPSFLKPLWRLFLKRQFRHFSKLLESKSFDLITFDGRSLPLLAMLPTPRRSAYYCVDPVYVGEERRFSETKQMESVDRVIAISTACQEALLKQVSGREVHLLPHGIDFRGAARSRSSDGSPPADLPKRHPIIGYTGSIHDVYVDFDKVSRAARENPNWTFLFVGPYKGSDIAQDASSRIRQLMGLPNIHFVGSKPYHQLRHYINAFDLCIIPYRHDIDNGWEKRSPVKMLHYLCTGKPIVCADVPAAADYRDVIYIYRDYGEFVRSIKAGLTERPDDPKRQARVELAKSRDCDLIIDQLVSVLG